MLFHIDASGSNESDAPASRLPPLEARIPLPHSVDHATAKAKFSKKHQKLTLTLAVRR